MNYLPNLLILLFFYTIIIKGQDKKSICESKNNCEECIRNKDCIWCIDEEINGIHCRNKLDETKCSNNIINPQSTLVVEENSGEHINPSKVKMSIRPGETLKLDFTVKQPQNYPVDMYFLLDNSKTMNAHRLELAKLAFELQEILLNLTDDVTMGFGSFVDKPILPYVETLPERFSNPCSNCVPPYSFKNHLPLTSNISQFSTVLTNLRNSANIDPPEGGLDALMQAIVCPNIGWRRQTRRLLILCTDDLFHMAGDGKLAGIVDPNDGLCHLQNDEYSDSLLQDYPSLGFINKKAREQNIFVVLAVTENVRKAYESFRDNLLNSYIGILGAKSNVISLVKDIYMNITETVRIDHNFDRSFTVSIRSNCSNFLVNNYTCRGISSGEQINFSARITLKECPLDRNFSRVLNINPSGLRENITFDIDMQCNCGCEYRSEKNSPQCSGIGDLECGVCRCPDNKKGFTCQCDADANDETSVDDDFSCKKDDVSDVCSGAGICKCGQCSCDNKNAREYISGKYCECNTLFCLDTNDNICSTNGRCDCGTCICNAGWSGSKCDCLESTDACIKNGTICSSEIYGECKCGKCHCRQVNGHIYSGAFCEVCTTCPDFNCEELECVVFDHFNGVPQENFCKKNVTVELVDTIPCTNNNCSVTTNDGCKIFYCKKTEEDMTFLQIQREPVCPAFLASTSFLVGAPILTILLASLICFLIFKMCDDIKYRKEFAKFENSLKFEQEGENPLYKSPNTTISNPMYAMEKNNQ